MSNVRVITPADPTSTLAGRLGENITQARRLVDQLTLLLRQMDTQAAQLAEQDVTITYSLGPVGDSAAAARRDLEKEIGPKFSMPAVATGVPPRTRTATEAYFVKVDSPGPFTA